MSAKEIIQLPLTDRLELAEQLWNSIETGSLRITDAQRTELDSRIAVDNEGRMLWYSMEEIIAQVQGG